MTPSLQNLESVLLTCTRCTYTWLRRSLAALPKQCPACRNKYWDKPRIQDHGPLRRAKPTTRIARF